jgi:hypothetical protein
MNLNLELQKSENYYGELGRAYLSNSDIEALLYNPKAFKQDKETTKDMLAGSLFHYLMIEPDKAGDIISKAVDASTRTTKVYKEYIEENGLEVALLTSEVEQVKSMVETMRSNQDFYSEIYEFGNRYEEAGTTTLFDLPWKGKADVVSENFVIDLKTTSSIKDFKWSANKYNYDSQAYIYQEIFGKSLKFFVVEKETFNLAVFTCSDAFLERGYHKVKSASDNYELFFGKNKVADPNKFYLNQML